MAHTVTRLFTDFCIVNSQKKSVTDHVSILRHVCNVAFVNPVLLWTERAVAGGEEGQTMQYFLVVRGHWEWRLQCTMAIRLKG